jgi:polyribonucleotide nucleotidyltransferase
MKSIKKVFQYGNQEVIIETGEIARQTDSAVVVSIGGTSVLVTAVGKRQSDPNRSTSY